MIGAGKGNLREQFGKDFAMDIGEAEITSLVFEGEFFVIESECVEDVGVQVVNVGGVLGDVVSEGVGLTVRHAGHSIRNSVISKGYSYPRTGRRVMRRKTFVIDRIYDIVKLLQRKLGTIWYQETFEYVFIDE